jgi:hypothetical protein
MNTMLPAPANVATDTLRQQWHDRIDAIPESDLPAAHELWVQTEIDRLLHKVAEGGAKDFEEGKLDPADIDRVIKEFRSRHPYR